MKEKLPVILALIFGLIAACLTYLYFQKQNSELGNTRVYLISKTKISKGVKFSQQNVSAKKIPITFAPSNAVLFSEKNNIIDTKSSVDIREGQVLLWEYVESGIEYNRLSDLLGANERALTISCDNTSGIEGMIQPNDRVDILGTFSTTTNGGQKTVTFLLNQNVTVLAAGSNYGRSQSDRYSSITLKVTPEEAEIISFAEDHGKLRLLLRNRKDLNINEDISEIDFSNIIPMGKKAINQKSAKMPKVTYQ